MSGRINWCEGRAIFYEVAEGTLVEDRFSFSVDGLLHSSRERHAGASFTFDAAYIHGLRHAGGPPATSIHCYSPPLWRMGYYDADQHGSLIRTSLSYLEELTRATTAAAEKAIDAAQVRKVLRHIIVRPFARV